MTDVIIVHSQIGNAHNHWYQWLKHNLALEGYNVQLFNLDKEDNKKLDTWIKAMKPVSYTHLTLPTNREV